MKPSRDFLEWLHEERERIGAERQRDREGWTRRVLQRARELNIEVLELEKVRPLR